MSGSGETSLDVYWRTGVDGSKEADLSPAVNAGTVGNPEWLWLSLKEEALLEPFWLLSPVSTVRTPLLDEIESAFDLCEFRRGWCWIRSSEEEEARSLPF